jgi:succinyl-diaminopimelate desuccinylase
MVDNALLDECRQLVRNRHAEIITLCQSMVKIPSLPGNEGPVADLVFDAMQKLDYDETWIDAAGNVIGVVRGGEGPTTMLNGHMDVVDAGNVDDWRYPPFGAEIHEGYIWGRGSADMKGPLAGMIFAAGLFKGWNHEPKGDVIVCAVSLEEVGGWGTHLLMGNSDLSAERAVVGEPTNNHLLLGHRGRIILHAHIKGTSMHSSIVNHDANPLFSLARFIVSLPGASDLLARQIGYLTVTPTVTTSSPTSANATPSDVTQTLDVRVGPGVESEMIALELNELLRINLGKDCSGSVDIAKQKLKTYTGIELEVDDFVPGYELPMDDPWAGEAGASLRTVLARDPFGELARFTCDACRLHQAGIPAILFGPGDISLAHTARERIPIEQLLEGIVGYMALVL